MRENLSQIESRGVSLDYELSPLHWLSPRWPAISTRTPSSHAARSTTTANGSPRSHAISLRSTSARRARVSARSASKAVLDGRVLRPQRRQHLSPRRLLPPQRLRLAHLPHRASSARKLISSPQAKISPANPSRFPKRPPPRSATPAAASASASASALPPAAAHIWFKNFLLSNGESGDHKELIRK